MLVRVMTEVECDVLIVGGGIGGMSAAISAARCGASTLLLEKRPLLGGILRAGLTFPVCGLFDNDGALLNDGLSREIVSAVSVEPTRMGRVWVWPCLPSRLLDCFETRLFAESRLEIRMHTAVTAVREDAGRIVCVEAGDVSIHPKVVIECSGNGSVLQRCSAGTLDSNEELLGGYSVRLQGLKDDSMLPIKVPHALRNTALPEYFQFTVFSAPDCLKLAVPPDIGETELQSGIAMLVDVLRNQVAAFEEAEIAETSPYVMQREGARLRGRYILDRGDVLSGRKFRDAAARCAWPIERWQLDAGQQLEYLPDGTFYEIPLRCLQSADMVNLLAAGRCLSATSEALASARVMGTCIATGEAAGKAAAEACS